MDVVAVVGLGYVGLSLAVSFGTRRRTIGVDLSARKVANYRLGIDPTGEVSGAQFAAAKWLSVGCDAAELAQADYIIVSVPTPVDSAHNPDFSALTGASRAVGRHMKGAPSSFSSRPCTRAPPRIFAYRSWSTNRACSGSRDSTSAFHRSASIPATRNIR